MSLQCLRYTSDLSKRTGTARKNRNFSKIYCGGNVFSVSANVQRNNEPHRYDFILLSTRVKDLPDSYLQSWYAHQGKKKKNNLKNFNLTSCHLNSIENCLCFLPHF